MENNAITATVSDFLVAFNKYENLMEQVRKSESYQWALNEMDDDTNEKYALAVDVIEKACKELKNIMTECSKIV